MPIKIPTVDISCFLRHPDSREAQEVISTVQQACVSSGFFLIKGHGVSTHLQKGIFEAASKFFKLPFEQKLKLDAKKNKGMRGYDVLASQQYVADIMPDSKEGFYIGPDVPMDGKNYGRFFMGPSVWPPESQLAYASFKDICEAYYDAVMNLSVEILRLLARTLPYGPNVFDDFISHGPAAPMRLLHYPPPSPANDKTQYGASPHTDFGAITLLLQDGNPGLQVFDADSGAWQDVPPMEETFVVNVGDMLTMWTGGAYKSSIHRVINPNPVDRYSVVFFFDGNLDHRLDPLDGTPGQGVTVEAYMVQKMAETYGYAKKNIAIDC